MDKRKVRIFVLLVPFLLLLHSSVRAQSGAAASREFLLLEVQLDGITLSEAIPAYADSSHTFLPLGSLANLLTLGIDVSLDTGTAEGFIVTPEALFGLDVQRGRVSYGPISENFDPSRLVIIDEDDIYIASSLLERWLPIQLDVNYSRLLLTVIAKVRLPLQAKLERLRRQGESPENKTARFQRFPKLKPEYQLATVPFIDQTLSTQATRQADQQRIDNRYSAFLTSDLLYMESALRINIEEEDEPDLRATLSRYDPEGELLGPLEATSVVLGNYGSFSNENINRAESGNGVTVSNRLLTTSSSYDQQTLEGDLPPGWDVELYYNDVFVGLQEANEEGRYRFEDLPLNFGRNDFRLVFNGPLGQTRVETQSFDLSDSLVPPGQFKYRFSEHRDEQGNPRSTINTDFGLTRQLTASAGYVRTPLGSEEEEYGYSDIRMFGAGWSGSVGAVDQLGHGHLTQASVRTRLGGTSVRVAHALLNDFDSEIFPANNDPVTHSTTLRINGALRLPSNWLLPFTIDSANETRESGTVLNTHAARISAYVWGSVLTNSLNWQETMGPTQANGSFTASRRIGALNFRSQLDYSVQPDYALTAFGINGSLPIRRGYRFSAGINHQFESPNTRYSLGLAKTAGRFGLAFNGSYDDNDDYLVGAQLFVSIGPRPHRRSWRSGARPVADTGATLVRVFHDRNNNGLRDNQEPGLQDVGVLANGARHPGRSSAEGSRSLIDYRHVAMRQ